MKRFGIILGCAALLSACGETAPSMSELPVNENLATLSDRQLDDVCAAYGAVDHLNTTCGEGINAVEVTFDSSTCASMMRRCPESVTVAQSNACIQAMRPCELLRSGSLPQACEPMRTCILGDTGTDLSNMPMPNIPDMNMPDMPSLPLPDFS